MDLFNLARIDKAFELAFDPSHAGYRPEIFESPDGDGVVDTTKRYAHVAKKYQSGFELMHLWRKAFWFARGFMSQCGRANLVCPEQSTLRFLEYEPGGVTAPHCDFDLFTVNCWTDVQTLRFDPKTISGIMRGNMPSVHAGELWPLLMRDGKKAVRHWTEPVTRRRRALVFFAVPPADTIISKTTVADFLRERKERSRVKATQ